MPSGKRERKRSKQERQQAYQAAHHRRRRRQGRLVMATAIIAALGIGFVGVLSFVGDDASDDDDQAVQAGSTTSTSTGRDAPCPRRDGTSARRSSFKRQPPFCIDTNKTYRARMETDAGTFVIELDVENAPETVNNFVFLARYHFFDQVPFHRVARDFVIQGGNPPGEGVIGPGYTFADENVPRAPYTYQPGDMMMARELPNTNGSQFLIATGAEAGTLPLAYPLFAKVTEGLDVIQRINADGGQRRRASDPPNFTPKVMHTLVQVTIIES